MSEDMTTETTETNMGDMQSGKYASEPMSPEEQKYTIKQVRKWNSTTKSLLWFVMINGVAWIWCSYILAWFDKVQIAESLSSNVCTVVLGQIFGYLITKTVENIFKYNNFGGKSKYTE